MKKRATAILQLALVAMVMTACNGKAPADKVVGSYSGAVTLETRYQKGSNWRDTAYVAKNGNALTLIRVDDNTVGLSMHSDRWGDVTADALKLTDLNASVNLSGSATHDDGSQRYDAIVSGTYSVGTGAIALNAIVKDYPYSGGKYNLSFTNSSN